jgi:hypothetical protein
MAQSLWGFDVEITKWRGREMLDSQRWLSEYLYFAETGFEDSDEDGERRYAYRIGAMSPSRPASEARAQSIDSNMVSGPPVYGPTSLHKLHIIPQPESRHVPGISYTIMLGKDAEGPRYRDHRNRFILPERRR